MSTCFWVGVLTKKYGEGDFLCWLVGWLVCICAHHMCVVVVVIVIVVVVIVVVCVVGDMSLSLGFKDLVPVMDFQPQLF